MVVKLKNIYADTRVVGSGYGSTFNSDSITSLTERVTTSGLSLNSAYMLWNSSGVNYKMSGENFLDWLGQESIGGGSYPIGAAYGGTGVANNSANTLTYSGNYGLTLTLTGTTGVTLPTSGTLATTTGSSSSMTGYPTGAQPLDSDLTALAGISGVRGDIIYYGASGWTRLAKGTENYYLKQGANDPAWASGSGGGASAFDDLSDVTITSPEQGDVLYYNGSAWVNIVHGTSGQYLKTGGHSANPSWDTPSTSSLDINGMTEITTIATGDEFPIYDLSNTANRKITWGNLMAAPGAIGGTTPAAATFTGLTLSTTPLGAAYGGTGVANNAANTLTYSGNYGLTITLSGTTNVTLPTSGTLATTSGSSSSMSGYPTGAQPLDADLTALAAFSGEGGAAFRTASNTWTLRSLTGTSNQITVTNGDGISGAPTISLPSSITLPGSLTLGGNVAIGAYELQSTGDIVLQLGDAAGANKLSIQDSASNEIFSVNSDGGVTTARSATPASIMKDADCTDSDDNYKLGVNATDTGSGSEDIDITEQIQIAGTLTTVRLVNADGTYKIGTASMPVETGSTIELGNASDTTLSRSAAGELSIEGVKALTETSTNTITNKTLSTGCVVPVTIGIACSDETTALTTGTAKATFRMPHAMTLTAVRASVGTAPVGSTIIVDINEGGSTIMTTNKLSIDASEKTSTTAATPAGITDSTLADDAEITIDIDQIGSSTAGAGLKIWLIGTRTL
jgi:hypothetical protein